MTRPEEQEIPGQEEEQGPAELDEEFQKERWPAESAAERNARRALTSVSREEAAVAENERGRRRRRRKEAKKKDDCHRHMLAISLSLSLCVLMAIRVWEISDIFSWCFPLLLYFLLCFGFCFL